MEEGDVVLCTVEQVSNTITHVRLPDGSDGTIISSEIAPGRIKHMRHYVVPNKKIVCKVLSISGKNIHLSLRRVTSKEKKEVMQRFKQDQALLAACNQLLPNAESVVSSVLKDFSSLSEFASQAKDDASLLEKYVPSDCIPSIQKILDKKKKGQELKQAVKLKCLDDDGLVRVKEMFSFDEPNLSVSYIAAGNYNLKLAVDDFKEGKKRMNALLDMIRERASASKCELHISDEK